MYTKRIVTSLARAAAAEPASRPDANPPGILRNTQETIMVAAPRTRRWRFLGAVLSVITIGLTAGLGPLVLSAPAASAMPCQTCHGGPPPPPPPPPPPSPTLDVSLAQQTTDQGAVQVAGWTAQSNTPQTALTVQISIDGGANTTLTANASNPTVPSQYGPDHGFDVTIPASKTAQQVCVTALQVGGGANTTHCQQIDKVVRFVANGTASPTTGRPRRSRPDHRS